MAKTTLRGRIIQDHELVQAIRESLLNDLWIDPSSIAIDVRDGVVYLNGRLYRRSEKELVEMWVGMASGLVDLESTLTYNIDDREFRPESQEILAA